MRVPSVTDIYVCACLVVCSGGVGISPQGADDVRGAGQGGGQVQAQRRAHQRVDPHLRRVPGGTGLEDLQQRGLRLSPHHGGAPSATELPGVRRANRATPGREGLAEPRVEDQVDSTLTEKAIAFIRRNADKPFFLYFTPCAPHTHVTPAANFRGTSDAGLYGDHVQELDSHVGELLQVIDELKLADNTLVVFTSDNGSTPKDFKGTQGVKLNLADDSGDIRKKFKTAKEDAKKLGHVTNGPWRDGKGYSYEGGHRIPLIARWPNRIAAGSSSDCMVNLTDLFATSAAVVGRDLPSDAAEDSLSLLPVLLGKEDRVAGREAIFILGNGKDSAIAVRSGKWKLVVRYGAESKRGNELYDLSNDSGEVTNVADAHPDVAKRLAAALKKAEEDGKTRP